MSNPTVVFDPYASDHRDIVQAIVDNYCVASTGKAEWYPVAFFLKNENGEVLGGMLGDIWAAWLHVRTLGGGRAYARTGLEFAAINRLVHQVSDWCSGAAGNFGWMREAKRENTRCGL